MTPRHSLLLPVTFLSLLAAACVVDEPFDESTAQDEQAIEIGAIAAEPYTLSGNCALAGDTCECPTIPGLTIKRDRCNNSRPECGSVCVKGDLPGTFGTRNCQASDGACVPPPDEEVCTPDDVPATCSRSAPACVEGGCTYTVSLP